MLETENPKEVHLTLPVYTEFIGFGEVLGSFSESLR